MTDPDWKDSAEKLKGQNERESRLQRALVPFWKVVGLPHYKTLVGSSFAWCGLFVAAMLYQGGHPIARHAAGARNWATYGQEINWRRDGIPAGAIVHINHKHDCSSGSGNHVAFANGNCAASDLAKAGATVPLLGGNQANQIKVSAYSVREVCEVRWPPDEPLPAPVAKSENCGGTAGKESTR